MLPAALIGLGEPIWDSHSHSENWREQVLFVSMEIGLGERFTHLVEQVA